MSIDRKSAEEIVSLFHKFGRAGATRAAFAADVPRGLHPIRANQTCIRSRLPPFQGEGWGGDGLKVG